MLGNKFFLDSSAKINRIILTQMQHDRRAVKNFDGFTYQRRSFIIRINNPEFD